MNSASLCSLAGRYENPIPPQCLAPIDFLKIPALSPLSVVMEQVTPQQCPLNVIYIRVLRGHCSTYSMHAGIYFLFIFLPASCAGILEQSMGARNRVGIGLSHRPARLHRLAESIPGLLKSLKIPSLVELRAKGSE